mmetsp:Transcript_21354/g.31272  ORF Transcript_21354/g.31272 Transcript_21354/m.31272 type:complete len:164 (+) Transcript_21354:49-540(+)
MRVISSPTSVFEQEYQPASKTSSNVTREEYDSFRDDARHFFVCLGSSPLSEQHTTLTRGCARNQREEEKEMSPTKLESGTFEDGYCSYRTQCVVDKRCNAFVEVIRFDDDGNIKKARLSTDKQNEALNLFDPGSRSISANRKVFLAQPKEEEHTSVAIGKDQR